MTTEPRNSPAGQVAVLHKALDLLECLAAGPLTAADISKRIGVAKPTVYRLLNTLQSRDYVSRDADGTRGVEADPVPPELGRGGQVGQVARQAAVGARPGLTEAGRPEGRSELGNLRSDREVGVQRGILRVSAAASDSG